MKNGHLVHDQAPRGLFVSLAPNGFAVELPDPVTGQSYPITIPLTVKGLMVLQKILREREREVGRIGHNSSPVQQMIEQWLLEDRKRIDEEQRAKVNAKAQADVAELASRLEGIDLAELDL